MPYLTRATIQAVVRKRDEYLGHLRSQQRNVSRPNPARLQFDVFVPKEEADWFILYVIYASPGAFQTHWT